MGYEINIDIAKIDSISEHLREARKKYWQFESEFTGVDPRVLIKSSSWWNDFKLI